RRDALDEFAPLLITHAKPEEQTLYEFIKRDEDMRENGFEGDVEHAIADQLLEEIDRTESEDLWSARVKVLAELVEHHIQEEEEELLPQFKKHSDADDRANLGSNYLNLKIRLERAGGKEAPSEEEMPEQHTHL
ncbi:MAG: hemerythrin domain-containing protein, partial [Bdellovibrio sp.]